MLGAQPHSNFMTNSGPEDRKYKRDSLFMSIMIAVPNLRSPVKVLIWNLSAGGMKIECDVPLESGASMEAHLRNIGFVTGTIAWREDRFYGVKFNRLINPNDMRAPQGRQISADAEDFRRLPPVRTRTRPTRTFTGGYGSDNH